MSSELHKIWESAGGTLPADWGICALESLLADNKAIAVGVMYPGPDTPGGIPLIKVGDIKDGTIPVRPSYCVSAQTNQEYKRTQLSGNELLVTLVGNPGECVVAEPYMAGWNPARAIAVLRLKDPSYRVFVKAVLESRAGRHLIDAVLNTTVQKTLNLKDVRKLPIPLPKKQTVDAISTFADALTNRISLLRETNATLEAIARALFKSWFIDLDPVRAKQEGREPDGMDAETAALFPDEFETSESGLVPKGWRYQQVESFADKVGMGPFGSNIKVETFVNQGVPVISGQHLRQTLVEDSTFNFITEQHAEKLANSCVHEGDVIFTHAGSIGQVALLHRDALYRKYVLSQRQFYLRCNLQKMRPEWITYYFRSAQGQHQLLANTSQVGVPSIARPVSYLRSIQVCLPSKYLIDRFSDLADAAHQKAIANRNQISSLVQLRDTLLPRLISGQLRLPEAEEQFNEALTAT